MKSAKSRNKIWACCLLVCPFAATNLVCSQDAKVTGTPSHELRHAAEIRRLTVAEANRNIPVRLRAVVTYYGPQRPDLFVQDQTGGIWVDVETTKLNVPVSAGDLVEVTGVTEQPDFAPEIGKPHFTLLGRAALPKPKRVTYRGMASTMEDSLRVEVEGIVHRVWKDDQVLLMDVAVDGGNVWANSLLQRRRTAELGVRPGEAARNLWSDFNSNYQLIGVNVHRQNCMKPLSG